MSFLFIAAIVVTIGGVGYWATQQEKKRALALQALAERLGWTYHPAPFITIIHGPSRFELFTSGRSQEIRNHAAGEMGGRPVSVFDFSYVTGAGKSRTVWRQTVVHVQLPGMELPAFALRPEHALHRIGGLFGYQDIDLEADPDFSRRYLLRGEDEAGIRALFDADVRDFYDRNPKSCTEAAGADLFYWRTGKLVKPEEIDALLESAVDLAGRFARHATLPPATDA